MYDQNNSSVCSLDNPASLEAYCLDFICDHLDDICIITPAAIEGRDDENSSLCGDAATKALDFHEDHSVPSSGDDRNFDDEEPMEEESCGSPQSSGASNLIDEVMKFPSDEVFFPNELSEQLLEKLCQNGQLNDRRLSLFDVSSTRLRHVRIKDASQLTQVGLKMLSQHRIVDLEVVGLSKATVGQLIDSLNSWTLSNCRSLNVSQSTFVDHKKTTVMTSLCKFHNLTSLNVSGTQFNKTSLQMIVQDIPTLENLDISSTKVTDLSALLFCKDRLKALSMYALKLPSSDEVNNILVQLHNLRHLDISTDREDDQISRSGRLVVSGLLSHKEIWPHLVSFDISGLDDINVADLKRFVIERKYLKFLGLMMTEACKDEMFKQARTQCNGLVVTGSANEAQILESLRRYQDRQHYVKKSLSNLFILTQGLFTPRVDIIELVLAAAHNYQTVIYIQMAVTACLFHLSKNEIGQRLHPKILGQIVKVDLDAMELFRYNQLQRNVLLTICNDRILQEVNFDKYRCARLVMDCLCAWQDSSMIRMSVAICSILAAKISTQETSQLGSQPKYMSRLLTIVRRKVTDNVMDVTLKFTLSALWNLTDESPQTCSVFLSKGGMGLFLQVLQTFSDELSIKTKVLGLLNNIAEVEELRSHLMIDEFVSHLRELLRSADIEVSYFAAGIAAHLCSNSQVSWTVMSTSKEELIKDLASVVESWQNPENEMVAYRSFRPFFPLMNVKQVFAVQLWAVWAIHHVCSKNPKRYCPMLVEQGGDVLLTNLIHHPDTTECVHSICGMIVKILSDKNF